MQLVFGLLGIGMILAAILMGSSLSIFINAPSALLVFGGTLCLSLAFFRLSELGSALRAARDGGGTHRDVVVLRALRSLAMHTGLVGMISGIVGMLNDLNDPAAIGPSMAVALLSILYAVILSEGVFGPLASRASHALDVALSGDGADVEAGSRGGAGVVFGLLGLGALASAGSLVGQPWVYFNAPSALLVVGGTCLFTLAFHPMSVVAASLGIAYGRGPLSAESAKEPLAVLGTMRMLAVGLGVLGTLIGLVSMLANMDDPSAIGPAMAVALLTLLYGIGLGELWVGPLIGRLRRRVASANPPPSAISSNSLAAFAALMGMMVSFMVLLLSFK